jgi:hypothetical protein
VELELEVVGAGGGALVVRELSLVGEGGAHAGPEALAMGPYQAHAASEEEEHTSQYHECEGLPCFHLLPPLWTLASVADNLLGYLVDWRADFRGQASYTSPFAVEVYLLHEGQSPPATGRRAV